MILILFILSWFMVFMFMVLFCLLSLLFAARNAIEIESSIWREEIGIWRVQVKFDTPFWRVQVVVFVEIDGMTYGMTYLVPYYFSVMYS